jgi:hypothetical protein
MPKVSWYRTAMPTYYHHTDDPNFSLDPHYTPQNADADADMKPGVFVTTTPDAWTPSHDRPYVAEVDGPDRLDKLPGADWYQYDSPGQPDEFFVPADQYQHLKLRQVKKRK